MTLKEAQELITKEKLDGYDIRIGLAYLYCCNCELIDRTLDEQWIANEEK